MEIEILQTVFSDFPKTTKFDIACIRLMLEKVGVNGFTGPRSETDVRYEFGFKTI